MDSRTSTSGSILLLISLFLIPVESIAQAVVIEHELVLTTELEGLPNKTRQCQAEISLSYTQKNTVASVEAEVENTTCGASSGSLVLSVRTVDASGEQSTHEFPQTWMREDEQPVRFRGEYPIDEDVELVRVRALRLQCTCAVAWEPGTAGTPAE